MKRFFFFFLLLNLKGFSQSSNYNYIRTRIPDWPQTSLSKSSSNDITNLNWNYKSVLIQYFDGLGRPLQNVVQKGSPLGDDVVQPVSFDENGRERYKYLPYTAAGATDGSFKTNALNTTYSNSDHYAFYTGSSYTTARSTVPFAETDYEHSPLNRAIEQGAPGTDWQIGQNTIQITYSSNKASVSDNVLLWTITGGNVSAWNSGNPLYFNDDELNKTIITDENGKQSIEFRDKLGRVLLKRQVVSTTTENNSTIVTMDKILKYPTSFDYSQPDNTTNFDTYYIYNELGQLAYVVPPAAVNDLSLPTFNYSFDENAVPFKDYIYGYYYDERGRLSEKKIPGQKGWIYYVYNKLDQVILTQTPELRKSTSNEWLFTKYDALGRIIMTGMHFHSSQLDQGQMQSFIDNLVIPLWETRSTSNGSYFGYTSISFPNLGGATYVAYVVNYYDDYNFTIPSGHDYVPYFKISKSNRVQGLLTGSLVMILDGSFTYLKTINYYDEKGRLIQEHKQNHLSGWDVTCNKYSFVGKLLLTSRLHWANGASTPLIVDTKYEYDHEGRIRNEYEGIGVGTIGTWKKLCHFDYNELGQMIKKSLDEGSNPTYLQLVDYRYNIRGWLSSINNATLYGDLYKNSDFDDVFGEEIFYNNSSGISIDNSGQGNLPVGFNYQFNGNISAVNWKTRYPTSLTSERVENLYVYHYDDINRLTGAYYVNNSQMMLPGYYDNGFHNFDEKLTYDMMGNIRHLYRQAQTGALDDLNYDYTNTGNQVASVTDAIAANSPNGFTDNNSSGSDYDYDDNGNLKFDLNKKITQIEYNFLNLPTTVTDDLSKTTNYIYDATGRKLQQIKHDNTSHYYVDGIEYEGTNLQFIMTPEGRAKPNGSLDPCSTPFLYDYFIKDHLGNIRSVITRKENIVPGVYVATMEDVNYIAEEQQFDNIALTRDIKPLGWSANTSTRIAKLNRSGNMIGPAKWLQVHGGDILDISAKYFYETPLSASQFPSIGDILNSLAQIFILSPTNGVPPPTDLPLSTFANNTFNPNNPNTAVYNFLNQNLSNPPNSSAPYAFLIYLTFDKQFNFISSASGVLQVNNHNPSLLAQTVAIPVDGFTYIYVSNEYESYTYFDDLTISHSASNLLEVNDYYPYGYLNHDLSFQSTDPVNNYKFNGKELQNDLNFAVEDFGARHYDPVIGRWLQVDPLAEQYRRWTPYNFGVDNPVRFIDPDGMAPNDGAPDNGDHVGFIQSSNEYQREYQPGAALVRDLSAFLLNLTPVGTIDNFVYALNNKEASTAEKVVAGADVVLSGAIEKPGRGPVRQYEVGTYSGLKAKSVPGDNLEIHHTPQSKPAGQAIADYNKENAPSIALTKVEHQSLPTRKGEYKGNARDQLAKDVKDLRKNTNTPTESLQELIKLNKQQYPDSYQKQ